MPDTTAPEQPVGTLAGHVIDNLERRARADIAAGARSVSTWLPARMLLSLIAEVRASRARDAGVMVLFHRTTPEAARQIHAGGAWVSRENTAEVYFSDRLNGEAVGYGPAVVMVAIPQHLAELEDEFPDGEHHYRVRAADLRPEHVTPLSAEGGAR